MKALFTILITIGFLFLAAAILGRFFCQPRILWGVRVISAIVLANTSFLLAIIVKLSEKK
ncbi:MAG: hypothetical protein NTW13_04415 [Candidatus Omnitrophica bacterium]|nr:hypothetical protein [Candidatus Omnitrophota bacterium]